MATGNQKPATWLDDMATLELAQLAQYGLARAYGSSAPDNLTGEMPITMRWISQGNFYNEARGFDMKVWPGPQDATYHVNIYLILGTGDPPSTMFTNINGWMERVRDCYLTSAMLGGDVQSVKVANGKPTSRVMGTINTYGIDFEAVVLSTTTPPIHS